MNKIHSVWGNEKISSINKTYLTVIYFHFTHPASDIFTFAICSWQTKRFETFFLPCIIIRLHWKNCTARDTHSDKNTKDNYILSDIILQIKLSGYLSVYNRKPGLFRYNTCLSFYLNIPNRVIPVFLLLLHCSLFTYLWTVLRLSQQSLLWLCPLMDWSILE